MDLTFTNNHNNNNNTHNMTIASSNMTNTHHNLKSKTYPSGINNGGHPLNKQLPLEPVFPANKMQP